jgi:bifunctional non-homologous end joining protein LigD
MAEKKAVRIGRYKIHLSRLDKEMYPEAGITKADVIDYYRKIAPVMLRHIEERPLVMRRFPDGVRGGGFYQKTVPDHFPGWLKRKKVALVEGGSQEMAVVGKAADLVYLADQACLVLHVWPSREGRIKNPDKMVFDLDPGGDDFGEVTFAARVLKRALDERGLASFVMTTGSKGLHVVVPLKPDHPFDQVRQFAKIVAERAVRGHPERLTIAARKKKRRGRLLIDLMRNAYGQTSVAPYALRALPGAPVAAPLEWDELGRSDLGPRAYTLKNIFRRLGRIEDPWRDIFRHRQRLGS